jgi:hypothetical protein
MQFAKGEHAMRRDLLRHSGQSLSMTWIAWGLASVLFLFTAENIWIDPWLRNKSHRIPSLVPEALSGAWFLALVMGGIALTLLVVCHILLIRERNLSVWTKVGTGVAVVTVLLLSVQWFQVTNGKPSLFRLQVSGKKHTVTLTWNASSSPVAGYNVYRSMTPGGNYLRINPSPVPGPSYTDNTVENGVTYYYVTRAVDAQGRESVNSSETSAAVP